MTDTTAIMGDKGRIVVTLATRRRYGWTRGTRLIIQDGQDGIHLLSPDAALARFRASVAGTPSPVGELIDERRAEAARENAASR